MRSITFYILLVLAFTACNKDEVIKEKAMHIVVNGYNGSNDALEVNIDTTRYDGKYVLNPASLISFNIVYAYLAEHPPQTITIKDPANGRVLFSKPMPVTGSKAGFNFIYVDGKVQELNVPAADPATNKLGFYINNTDSDGPVDILLYRKDTGTGKEYREYLVRNVKPKNWVYVNYIPPAAFESKIKLDNAIIYFTKTGTIDQWAFDNNEEKSKLSAFGKGLPISGETGLVLPYFIIPGSSQLEISRLFFTPDRIW